MANTFGDGSQSPLLSSSSLTSKPSYNSISPSADVPVTITTTTEPIHRPHDVDDDVVPETSAIGRTITWPSAYILTISRVLGSGIFATPGIILSSVGSPGLALTLWVIGAIVAYFGLEISLEYGTMLPRSGGEKVYLEFTYRRPRYFVSVLIAFQAILLGFTASNCVVFARYLLFGLGLRDDVGTHKVIAVALLTGITVTHAVFMRTGVRIQNVLGWIKIGLIVFMISVAPVAVFWRTTREELVPHTNHGFLSMPSKTVAEHSGLDWSWEGLWVGTIWSWGSIATSFLKVYYSYVGLNNLNNVLNEVKDPIGTLKSVTRAALLTVTGMYLFANVAFLMVVPLDEVKNSGELIAALFFQRVFGNTVGQRILPIVVALSAAGNVMVVTFAMSRLNQEIGRTGLLPFSKFLSSTRPFGSPLGGLVVHYIPSLLVITIPSGDVYSFILEVEGYPAQIWSFFIAFGLLWLRYKRPDLERPYKAWLPGVYSRIALAIAILVAPFVPTSEANHSSVYALVGTGM
jgi:amino acid transporter